MAACMWSDISGTWTKTGGDARTTNSNARTIHQSSWSGLDDFCEPDNTIRLEVPVQSTAYLDEIDIPFDWVDANNHHFVRLTLASEGEITPGNLALFKRTAGSDVNVNNNTVVGALINTTLTIVVCYDQETVRASVDGVVTVDQASAGHGGKRAGLGTGTITGTAKFLSFEKSHNIYSGSCEDCEPICTDCPIVTMPNKMRVRHVGGSCAEFNGTMICEAVDNCTGTDVFHTDCVLPKESIATCDWDSSTRALDNDEFFCPGPDITDAFLRFHLRIYTTGGRYYLYCEVRLTCIEIDDPDNNNYYVYRKDMGTTAPNLAALSNERLDWFCTFENDTMDEVECNPESAYLLVSAV